MKRQLYYKGRALLLLLLEVNKNKKSSAKLTGRVQNEIIEREQHKEIEFKHL